MPLVISISTHEIYNGRYPACTNNHFLILSFGENCWCKLPPTNPYVRVHLSFRDQSRVAQESPNRALPSPPPLPTFRWRLYFEPGLILRSKRGTSYQPYNARASMGCLELYPTAARPTSSCVQYM